MRITTSRPPLTCRQRTQTRKILGGREATPVDPAAARDAREALYMLDADVRKTWLHAGMALHSTGWGAPAFAAWSAWSQQSTKFDGVEQRKTWDAFKEPNGDRRGLTLAWLFASGSGARLGQSARTDQRPAPRGPINDAPSNASARRTSATAAPTRRRSRR